MRKWYAPFWMSGILVLASAAGLWGCGSYEKAETVSEQAGLAGSALLGIINQIIGLLWIFQILCSTDNGFA